MSAEAVVRQGRIEQIKNNVFPFNKKTTTTVIGSQGEDIAAEWLRSHGYTIIVRNYSRPFGEVDIIARQGQCLVFVEVKTRSSAQYGSPLDAITAKKQQQLSRIANDYLTRNRALDTLCRFDVVSVLLHGDQPPSVEVIVNAFECVE